MELYFFPFQKTLLDFIIHFISKALNNDDLEVLGREHTKEQAIR